MILSGKLYLGRTFEYTRTDKYVHFILNAFHVWPFTLTIVEKELHGKSHKYVEINTMR